MGNSDSWSSYRNHAVFARSVSRRTQDQMPIDIIRKLTICSGAPFLYCSKKIALNANSRPLTHLCYCREVFRGPIVTLPRDSEDLQLFYVLNSYVPKCFGSICS
jgi:hypothetical protein